jgi:CRISPR-associated protein Csd1
MHHLSKLRKEKPGLATHLDRKIGQIFELADADKLFVPTLTAQRQAMFALGYYHEKNEFYRRKDTATPDLEPSPTEIPT